MDIVLLILSAFLLLIGFVGCILPILPSVTISLAGLIVLHLTSAVDFSSNEFITFVVMVGIAILSGYVFPILFAKKLGGTKWGSRGSTIGMVVGLFFGPWGMVLGPIVGAFAGELLFNHDFSVALKAGFGSAVGFIFTTGISLAVASYFIYVYVNRVFF